MQKCSDGCRHTLHCTVCCVLYTIVWPPHSSEECGPPEMEEFRMVESIDEHKAKEDDAEIPEYYTAL